MIGKQKGEQSGVREENIRSRKREMHEEGEQMRTKHNYIQVWGCHDEVITLYADFKQQQQKKNKTKQKDKKYTRFKTKQATLTSHPGPTSQPGNTTQVSLGFKEWNWVHQAGKERMNKKDGCAAFQYTWVQLFASGCQTGRFHSLLFWWRLYSMLRTLGPSKRPRVTGAYCAVEIRVP